MAEPLGWERVARDVRELSLADIQAEFPELVDADEQAGRALSISPLTVRTHVQHIMEKLRCETRTQAVAVALRESLIE